ncbi:MAG: hypothetical protein A2806_03880 [Candidatus Terrybacteria bacterium RIFCSPHIGHO2_01_FULL_48_17]|uniref:Uncharacterized protein n=1 Tax=Candidatus Terrybacteria bacterium RIFCSPHIGHO2_01_FULL_48_17 TaxID=1802362 RepID=A0A1G2PM38_9BACT|nr:MAG: hypothetical protein A2806_03880 [Candidatus Terrybacteria bacterium RIFCSPHIGHO2_01_FULL_48_17]OHA53292.1 MAG: hypothetical protein A3A30_03870 [Candidatus Terrybacteria bacterium RIFCSPLOWO2_01_FULL_48_14]
MITDEYPVSARETLETDIPTDFLFGRYSADEIRDIFQREIKRHSKNRKKDHLCYPSQLVDAIVDAVAKAKQRA